MHTVEDIRLLPVWVNPEHLVATARLLMAGHRLRMLAVLEAGRLIGTVSSEDCAGAPDTAPVSSVQSPLGSVLESSMTVREAAEKFISENLDSAPVVSGERFLGILTSQLLLNELKHSWDPLTGLPWSDRLRDWGVQNLMAGREITILFFDTDDFGLYNKRHGHIVGDRVLKKVAEALSAGVDTSQDVLVRYGGDEFAVGTLRSREEAEAMASSLLTRVAGTFLEGTDKPITMCVGIYGGKRTQERENVHYAATLDNLINFASRDCLSKKKTAQRPLPMEKEVEAASEDVARDSGSMESPPVQIKGVYVDENSPNSLTIVILDFAGTIISGVHQRAGRTVLQSISAATAKALQRLHKDAQYGVEEILMVEDSMGEKFLNINGSVARGERSTPVSGVFKVGEDLYASAVQATLHAFAGEF